MCRTYSAPFNVLFGCQGEAYVVRSADVNLARVPAGMSDGQALLATDVLSTGFAAVERAHLKEGQTAIESAGGEFFFDLGEEGDEGFERKFKDPDGIIFDINDTGWVMTSGKK